MWTKAALLRVVQTKSFAIVASSLVASASGAVGGYFFAKKRLEKKYADISEQEIREAKTFYTKLYKVGDENDLSTIAAKYEDPDEPAEAVVSEDDIRQAAEILDNERYSTHVSYDKVGKTEVTEEQIEVKASIKKNIFDSQTEGNGEFDQAEEFAKRERGEPYIITKDEFFENETEFSQVSFEYFEDDDVLCDEQNRALTSAEENEAVGSGNLLFGRGSGDNNVVYIRNEKLEVEYEVRLCKGSFKEEVLGFIEHSEKRVRKFRVED